MDYIDQNNEPSAMEVDSWFSQYHIDVMIGRGAMGLVYHGQASNGQHVAIKLLLGQVNEDLVKQFHAEAQAMSVLDHPNLVRVYDYGYTEGHPYIVMEFVPGGTLLQLIHNHDIDQVNAAKICALACRGLSYIHQQGILHRDIKPDNIMIDESCSPKIMDFGLAADTMDQDFEYKAIGSVGYVAPEVRKAPKSIDVRSDVFSMGGVLYTVLTKETPAAKPEQIDWKKLQGFDARFKIIIRRAMQADREQRYSSVEQIELKLMNIIKSLELRNNAE